MLDRIAPYSPQDYFSEFVQSGSHLESLRWIMTGQTDAAAIDSNALLYQVNQNHIDLSEFTILETWGPFPIQPIVIRADMPFLCNSPFVNPYFRRTNVSARSSFHLDSTGLLKQADRITKDSFVARAARPPGIEKNSGQRSIDFSQEGRPHHTQWRILNNLISEIQVY